jgi:hypothetical protein
MFTRREWLQMAGMGLTWGQVASPNPPQIGSAAKTPEQQICISGVFPKLTPKAEHVPRSESGIGALMPWANRLWFVTYVSHKKGTGAGTGLFFIDDDFSLHKHPESVVGTYANRLIHPPTCALSDRI